MSGPQVVITPARGIEQSLVERVRVTGPLVRVWTARELRVRYRQSLLRTAWSLVQPMTILLTYGWVLTAVLDVSREEVPYLTFAWAGIVPFTVFSQGLGQGVGSIQQAGSIISRVYFPREVLPLAVIGCALVDLAIMTVTLVVTAWVQVGAPSIYLIGLIPVYLVLVVWVAAVTLVASAFTVFRRDLNFAVPLGLRVLFIVSPVMYQAQLIKDQVGWLTWLNPLAVIIEGTRSAVYRHSWPDAATLGPQFAVGTLCLFGAILLFRRLEPRMSDYV